MKKTFPYAIVIGLIGVSLWCSVFPVLARNSERCIVCGMDVSMYPHTRYVVAAADGKKLMACGAQCGLTLHLRLGQKWKSATASDLLSNRLFDATQGFYVFKSSVITDMAPGFVSFKRRVDAEKFAKGFGGQVLDYDNAVELWKKRMQ